MNCAETLEAKPLAQIDGVVSKTQIGAARMRIASVVYGLVVLTAT